MVPLVGVAGFLALGAQLTPWTAGGLVVLGVIVGVASVAGVQAARRRPRNGAGTNQRLGSLESLTVEHPPSRSEPQRRSDRPVNEPNDGEGGFAERVAAILDDGESRDTSDDSVPGVGDGHESVEEPEASSRPVGVSREPAGESIDSGRGAAVGARIGAAPRPVAPQIHHPVVASPAPAGSPAVVDPSPDPIETTDESVLSDLTSDDVAAMFNRYESLVRDDLDALSDDERHIDEEIWLDPTQGDAMPYIDATRRTAEGIWVYLRSGHVICKMRGSDVWICADDPEREPTKPTVVVSLVPAGEPTELFFSIVADPETEHTRDSDPIPAQSQWSGG